MADKYNTILQLAAETEKKVTGSAEEWRRFMDTAGRFCKYTFQDQLLIYAQRPGAAACAPITVWDKMGCWVNRGAKGIALVDTASPRQKLKYVFDMADVTPERRKNGRLPYIWSVKPEHEQAVIGALEAVYGKTDAQYPFADRVMEIMMEAARGIYEESARKIAPYVKGSFLEGEEWRPFSVTVYGAMLESAYCEVMGACGSDIRPQKYSFHDIKYFNTHGTLCMLGNEINAFARPFIAEIGRAVREYEKQREETKAAQENIEEKSAVQEQKSLASAPETGYNALKRESAAYGSEKENMDKERGAVYGTGIQMGRGLSDPGPRNGRTAGRGTEEIRPAAEKIPDGEQGGRVFDAPAGQRTDAPPVRDTGTGRGADGADRSADGGGHGSGRSPQSAGPDAVGQKNEQHPALGGGGRAGGDDLHLNNGIQPDTERKEPDNGAAPLSGSFQQGQETGLPDNGHSSGTEPLSGVFLHGQAPAGITPEVRKGILCSDSFLIHKRPEIAGYFAAEPDAGLQMEYFKNCFTFRTYYGLDVAGISVGFHASEKGLHINMSGRPGAENEALLSWEDARFFVNSYIEDGTYLLPEEKAEQQAHTDEKYEQLDIFSMLAGQAGGMDTASLSGGTIPFSKYRMPQNQIDEILRSGGGRDDCRKRIYAKYQQGKTPEEMAAFLRKEYGVTGKGFIFDGKQFAVWFDADGMRIGRGMSAWEDTVLSMSWPEIEQNIRSQVESGTYMSASEIYLVDEAERGRVADSLYFFFRDGMGELPEGLGLQAANHPDSHAALVRMLADPEGIECLAGHMDAALRQLETGEKQLRVRFRMPKEELRRELDNLMVQKLSFPAPESVHIRREDFITQDEIDGRLAYGSGIEGGKFRIYDYFKEGHGAADAAAFLKKEYGDGGSSQGLPGSDQSWEDHNHKGIRLKKGDIHAPYAETLLSWNTVAKHIQRLVAEDKYLSPEGKKAYLEYKKKQEVKKREKELAEKERKTKAACKTAIERTIAEKFDGQRLAKDAARTVIREYGAERVSYVLANTVTHLKSDGRFSSGNKEWAVSIEPYAMTKNSDLVVTSHPVVLDGFIDQARMYMEHEKAAAQQEQKKAVESMDGGSVFPGADMPVENVKSGNAGVDQVSAMSAGMAETKERSSVEDAESQAYYAVSLMPDNSADNYYISIMDGSTGVEIRPYRDSFGKLPAFQTVDEAADYCNRNGIDLQNAHEVDQWHNIEVEREKGKSRQGKDVPGQDASGHNAGMPPGMEPVPEKDIVLPEPHEAAASTVYPGDKNGMPYDIIVEKMHFGQEQDAPETAAGNDRPAAANFRITDDMLGTGTVKEKFRRNMEAIRTLERVEGENRAATPQEQHILSQYVGWGGLADAFDESRNAWAGEYRELKSLLSPGEYASARESTLNSHYTSPVVIRSIYSVLERMGFETGSILEPSMGTGNFFGMLPDTMRGSRLYGVELDGITGRIAKQLYPGADIKITGFEKTSYPNDFFDIAVGNVPFGQYRVPDRQYDKLGFPVHEYFLAKALDKVRPGGVMAFVTSRWVMDKKTTEARKYLAQRAELLGAVRLPNNAFKDNAGTEVTADILFFQKLDRMAVKEPEWVYLSENADGISMNRYFVEHPEMVVGRIEMVSGPYGMESACLPDKSRPFEEQLKEAVSHISGSISMMEFTGLEESVPGIPADPDVKNYSYTVVDGKVYYRENSIMLPADVPETTEKRIRGMVAVRDCTQELIRLQMEECPDSAIKEKQAELNTLYDNFTKSFGLVNSTGNKRAFSQDASYCLLCSLEKLDDKGNFKGKADMFTKRTIKRAEPVTSVETAAEALAVSLSEKAKVDLEFMAGLSGKDTGTVVNELSGVIFQDPVTKIWETAGGYLSGNVREKLKTAETFAENHAEYAVNVQALRRVQPKDLEASEIDVRIGATWIDMKYIDDFMRDVLQTPQFLLEQGRICTQYSKASGKWNIKGKNEDRGNMLSGMTYGTGRANAYKILEDSLNLKDVRIYDTVTDEDGRETRVLNKKETVLAGQKQEALREAFRTWVFEEPKRRQELCAEYNRLFNSTRPREYDGSHLKFPGMTQDIELQPHQLNAVAHQLYGANTLLAHCVGAGKTFEMAAAAMEARRLGLSQKCMFVVPNHLTGQWAADFLRLYPGANILAATKRDFETANRKKFCSRIATGEYDAVIIGHSQFAMIPLSAERQAMAIEQQIDEIQMSIMEAKAENGERYTIKQMEAAKKKLYAKLERLNDAEKKDNVVTFEQLGVDRLFVDESHSFKNLFLYTKMRNVAGIAQSEAQKSSDMFAKCRYMDELTGGKGITFATGTPISNSMTEMFTNMRYLQYDTLQRLGFGQFDAWASTFGETVTAVELAPEGTGYRTKTRFSKFYNLPELMSIFKECADIQTADMLKLPVPEAAYENVVLKPSEYQKEIVQSLAERAEAVRNNLVEPSEDNMLKITNDGRKLALDQRLVNAMLPDNENSKAAACVEKAFQIWESTKEKKSAQLIFCDLSTPKGDGTFNVYEDIRDRLVKKGVPEGEVAFIHSANTDTRKEELFAKVRSGQVRFLLGSTQKMGAGTNVQDRLIALHHLDIPWRPAEEERTGRNIKKISETGYFVVQLCKKKIRYYMKENVSKKD